MTKLSKEQTLLSTRLCDLELDLSSSWISVHIDQLYQEITSKGLNFKPHIWISDDWFSPNGIPGFAIPFYLLNKDLINLEKKYIGEAEGETKSWLMKLLRHETGHAIDNAFHLRKSKLRQELFGKTSTRYPMSYVPNKNESEFVKHLNGLYAQAHPDEDWAETFAVWLTPKSIWQNKYKNTLALEKLKLVDSLMFKIKNSEQLIQNNRTLDHIKNDKRTVAEYLKQKRKSLKLDVKIFDDSLLKLNSSNNLANEVTILNKNKKNVCKSLCEKTNLKSYDANTMYQRLANRIITKNKSLINLKAPNKTLLKILLSNSDNYQKAGLTRIIM